MTYDPYGKQTAMMSAPHKKDFTRMLKMYDDKKNSKAMELVDGLLESYPEHIECMSFKAMILS